MPIYVYHLGLRLSAWHLGVYLFTPGISIRLPPKWQALHLEDRRAPK